MENNGNVPLTNVNLAFAQGTFSCTPALSNLAPGATSSCTLNYMVTQENVDADTVTLSASPSGKHWNLDATVISGSLTIPITGRKELFFRKTALNISYAEPGGWGHTQTGGESKVL